MLPVEVEKLVLGTCLAHPNGTKNIPQRVVYELDLSRFGEPAHSFIFGGIRDCVYNKVPPTPANVALRMNGTLEKAGGLEYLESLPRFLSMVGGDVSSLGDWVRRVDLNGRVRLIHGIINKRVGIPLDQLQEQVSRAEDPEAFLSDIFIDINRYMVGSQSGYKPLSDAIDQFEDRLKRAEKGEVTEVIPCGIPNLMKYCIPRPRSFGVLQGVSGQGKTAMATYIGLGVADALKKLGQRGQVSLNIFEQSGERIVQRSACMLARVNSLSIAHAKLLKPDLDRLFQATTYLRSLPIIYNDDPRLTSSQFITHAVIANIQEPRILGISDYTELFQDRAESEELRISGIVRNVRTVAWETGSCELLLSQMNDSAVNSSYGIGGLFSSRYSRSPAHAADFYLEVLNYPQMRAAQIKVNVPDGRNEDLAYVLIEKNKDYPMGEEPFEWVAAYTLFRDVSLPIGKLFADVEQDDF